MLGEQDEHGDLNLYVAIADVARYVDEGSHLDNEAFDRGTSVYFSQRVIPMLPEELSNDLCSLKPDEDRFCIVCKTTVSEDGSLTDTSFFEAIINSKSRLTYPTVTREIEKKQFKKDLDASGEKPSSSIKSDLNAKSGTKSKGSTPVKINVRDFEPPVKKSVDARVITKKYNERNPIYHSPWKVISYYKYRN